MNIRDIPPNHEAFEVWSLAHERSHFRYEDANRTIATATRELFVGWTPGPLRPMVRVAIHAMLDDAMRESFGFRDAPAAVRALVTGTLRVRAKVLRFFPANTSKDFITGKPQRSWRNGYRISELGPPPLLEPTTCAHPSSVQSSSCSTR